MADGSVPCVMSAYLIADTDVHDAVAFRDYFAQTPAVVAAHGGRFLVRGGEGAPLEGTGQLKRIVILEFPTTAVLNVSGSSSAGLQ
jgi:uncharacterized protein (DUF1330 family)